MSYIAYLAAFANIGVLWMGHHTVFTRIKAVDPGVLWRNLVLLLTVSVVPFPTAVIANAYRVGTPADQSAAVVAYAVVGMAIGRGLAAPVRVHRRHPDLGDPLRHDDFCRPKEPLITLFGYAIAALIGWFVSHRSRWRSSSCSRSCTSSACGAPNTERSDRRRPGHEEAARSEA